MAVPAERLEPRSEVGTYSIPGHVVALRALTHHRHLELVDESLDLPEFDEPGIEEFGEVELGDLLDGVEEPTDEELQEQDEAESRPSSNEYAQMDTVKLMKNSFGRFKVPSPSRQIELAKRIRLGDEAAREEMINSNMRLVVKIAGGYLRKGLDFEDLIQSGALGLIRAVEKFDPGRGFRFSTYAAWWIHQAIDRSLVMESRTIHLPVDIVQQRQNVRGSIPMLTQELQRYPTLNEVAENTNYEPGVVKDSLDAPIVATSLNKLVGPDEETELGELIAVSSNEAEEETVYALGRISALKEGLDCLTPMEREILVLHYGLGNKQPLSYDEIAKLLGHSRDYISDQEKEILKRLARLGELRDKTKDVEAFQTDSGDPVREEADSKIGNFVDSKGNNYKLSQTDEEILEHLAAGLNNRQIAQLVGMTLIQLKGRVGTVYRRLGVSGDNARSDAVKKRESLIEK